ncbi:hypothetical protein D3OALGA1CA_5076 [Olavius algarvensis associated proteobacterium Delta 3]|nr:hypothetical protein D3OALGA1CA_5076 [Olavius algarvensis associated proteobacterium Delta 3]
MLEIQYLFIAAPLILTGISLLLQHFFDDSDKQRIFCSELRAKYLLTNTGPLSFIASDPSQLTNILKEFLRFRLVRLHFGIVNFIIIFGLGLVIAILLSTVILGFIYQNNNPQNQIKYFFLIWPSISLLTLFCLIVQITFARQNCKTAERIRELIEWDLNGEGAFEDQCSRIVDQNQTPVERQTMEIKGAYKWITDINIRIYRRLYSFLTVIIADAICLGILCPWLWETIGIS